MSTLRDIVGSDEPTTVENMQADRPLVDLLYARGVIDKKAKGRPLTRYTQEQPPGSLY